MECCTNRKTICIILKTHFETTGFRRIMLQNMIVLEKCLHFVDNGELGDSYNKAAKIQPILEKLVECFKLLCQLECNISIDDSPLLWRTP